MVFIHLFISLLKQSPSTQLNKGSVDIYEHLFLQYLLDESIGMVLLNTADKHFGSKKRETWLQTFICRFFF